MSRASRAAVLVRAGVLAGCLGGWLAGCDGSSSPAATPAATDTEVEVPGLTATLEQYREDEINGYISVKTQNGSSAAVEFRDLRLRWAGLTETEAYVRSTLVSPGVRFDIRVFAGDGVCGDPPTADGTPPAGAAVAVGNASIDGAAPVAVAVPIEDELGILPKVFERSCEEQRLRWAADLRFGDEWTPSATSSGKPAVQGTIELRRNQSDEPLTVTDINGSRLLRITPSSPTGTPLTDSSGAVATLDAGEDTLRIPITVEESGDCSPHALTESKKTFIIPIGFAIGNDEPLAYVIVFDDEARAPLNAMINESCGLG